MSVCSHSSPELDPSDPDKSGKITEDLHLLPWIWGRADGALVAVLETLEPQRVFDGDREKGLKSSDRL